MQTISFSYHVGHSTVSGIIDSTCDSLWTGLQPQYMSRPSSPAEWRHVSKGYEEIWSFPHCVRSVDGKHIVLQAPACSSSTFYNYKGTHSIVLLAVCDAHYCFTLVEIGDAGQQFSIWTGHGSWKVVTSRYGHNKWFHNTNSILFYWGCCVSSEDLHVTSIHRQISRRGFEHL